MTLVRRIVIAIIGSILVVAGLIFVPLPVVPGWAVVIAGLLVLSTEFEWAHRLMERIKQQLGRFQSGSKPSVAAGDDDEPDLRLSA